MSDLIEREDAIKALYKYNFVTKEVIEREIRRIPSADTDLSGYSDKLWKNAYERGKTDRPRGEWIDNGDIGTFKVWDCSICGIHMETRWNYCPNCGAKMDGECKENE